MCLTSAADGQRCRVTGLQADSPFSLRLMELGVIEGAEVRVLRRAPLGDPLYLRVGDYDLSLRSSEAAAVDIVRI